MVAMGSFEFFWLEFNFVRHIVKRDLVSILALVGADMIS